MDKLINISRTEGFPLNAEVMQTVEDSKWALKCLLMGMGGIPNRTAVLMQWGLFNVSAVAIRLNQAGTEHDIVRVKTTAIAPATLVNNPGKYDLVNASQYISMYKADGSGDVFENCIYKTEYEIVEVGTGGWTFIHWRDLFRNDFDCLDMTNWAALMTDYRAQFRRDALANNVSIQIYLKPNNYAILGDNADIEIPLKNIENVAFTGKIVPLMGIANTGEYHQRPLDSCLIHDQKLCFRVNYPQVYEVFINGQFLL